MTFKHSSLSGNDQAINDLIAQMTFEEKITQLSGISNYIDHSSAVVMASAQKPAITGGCERLGIPGISMADGPLGVRLHDTTSFPAGVAYAATWDVDLIDELGGALARDCLARGVNILLGPGVNIHRLPTGGRNFESFGEDPYLAAHIAVAYIRGLQRENVAACVKHFACNNQELKRHHMDAVVDERTLHEIYFPAFKAAVQEANVWTVMGAYNLLHGDYCCESKYLLDDVLKKQWGFEGVVISDWEGISDTVKAANSGMDLEMPLGKYFGKSLIDAVGDGEVDGQLIDDKVRRILRLKFATGVMGSQSSIRTGEDRAKNRDVSLKVALNSMVLIKNEAHTLPLDRSKILSIAVIGPAAANLATGGGGSSKLLAFDVERIHEALQRKLGKSVEIKFELGATYWGDDFVAATEHLVPPEEFVGQTGLFAEYFNNMDLSGEPVLCKIEEQVNFMYGDEPPYPGISKYHRSIRYTGKIKPPQSGKYTIKTVSDDGVRVFIDGKTIIDNWKIQEPTTNSAELELVKYQLVDIRIEYFQHEGCASLRFGWIPPDKRTTIDDAVDCARDADAAIVCTGLNLMFEGEGYDRSSLELPPLQEKLIKEIAAVNSKTIVVLNNGSQILMDNWINDVEAVLEAWYPGEWGSEAIAQIILGEHNPCGKLPYTIIKSPEQCPWLKPMAPESPKVSYDEGVFVGYRYFDAHKIEPQFPFGHGLSFTEFTYSDLSIKKNSENHFTLNCTITNSKKRIGSEIVQVYVHDEKCSVPRPQKELKSFLKVNLNPGESRVVEFTLTPEAFSFYDTVSHGWKLESGEFSVMIGSSSRDIRLHGIVSL